MFDNPLALWALLLVPVLMALMAYAWRCYKRFEQSPHIGPFLYQSKLPTWAARLSIGVVWLLAMALLIVGMAQPCVNVPTAEKKYKNVRIFFLVDVSRSMVYAEDIPPNRMDAARKELVNLYTGLDGHYECSIIPFSGSPNVYYCPLTYSKKVITPLLEQLGPETAPEFGTDLTAAVVALQGIIKKEKLDQDGVNIVVLISDGGKEEAEATNRVKLQSIVVDMATNKNCKFFVVGVGGKAPCELIKRYSDGSFEDYIRNPESKKIETSQLDEEILQMIAEQGQGDYCHFEQKDQMQGFLNRAIEKSRVEGDAVVIERKVYLEYYFYALAALLLWFAYLYNRRRSCVTT